MSRRQQSPRAAARSRRSPTLPRSQGWVVRERTRSRSQRRRHASNPPSVRLRLLHRSRRRRFPLPALRHRHRLDLGRGAGRTALPALLPDDEERRGEHDRGARDEDVQADPAELVRRVDAERLDPEAADAVDEDVEREQVARPDPPLEPPLDEEQQSGGTEAPQRLVQERRMEGLLVDEVDRAVLGVDLEAPREVRRLPEELLVPPVPEAPDSLRDEQCGRDAVRKLRDRSAGAVRDDGTDETTEADPAPDAE